MKRHEPMNWTKKQTQEYGVFMAILGALIGGFSMWIIFTLINFLN